MLTIAQTGFILRLTVSNAHLVFNGDGSVSSCHHLSTCMAEKYKNRASEWMIARPDKVTEAVIGFAPPQLGCYSTLCVAKLELSSHEKTRLTS